MATVTPPSDWQTGKTLSECFDHIFTSGIACDVTFIVGEEKKRISAHKLVLISRSPVFYAMLEGPMAEKGEITISDISEETFKLFLRYLYTDVIDLTEMNVVYVFTTARKYCVDILMSNCEAFVRGNITVDNACLFLEQAHIFMIDSLKTDCLRVIFASPTPVLQSGAFTDLCSSCVTSITESDNLSACENIVYKAIIKWAEAECGRQNLEATPDNKRGVLGDVLYTVRFTALHKSFVIGKVCMDLILEGNEVVDVINHTFNNMALLSPKINTNKRSIIFSRIHRNGPVRSGLWSNTPHDQEISFTASKSLILHGIGSFHTRNPTNTVDLKLFEGDVCLVKSTLTMNTSHPDTPNMGDVMLDTPIEIHAGIMYTIVERSHNQQFFFFENGQEVVRYKHLTLAFKNRPNHGSNGCADRGQIPYFLISC